MMNRKKVFKISLVVICGAIIIGAIIALIVVFTGSDDSETAKNSKRPVWGYKCLDNRCQKVNLTEISDAKSFEVCRIFCGSDIGTLWPKPRNDVKFKNVLEQIDPEDIIFQHTNNEDYLFWNELEKKFRAQILAIVAQSDDRLEKGGKGMIISTDYKVDSSGLTMNTDESYELSISTSEKIEVKIKANSYYGARHGLETLSQLIVYDDINNQLKCGSDVQISDSPKFKHRGISFDTSRTFFTIESLKRTIDAMAMVKMNVFHWHITDSHSFPIVVKSHPELTKYGAYSAAQTYTEENIKDLVQFAKIRGVRIIPEFDAPGHIGEGWQHTGLMLCFKDENFKFRGQMDPSEDELYNILEGIYRDFREMFGPVDLFHMGGDEVNLDCWNSSTKLKNWMSIEKGWGSGEEDFMELWNYFQEEALKRFDIATQTGPQIPIILWSSSLTKEPYLTKYLNKDRYIIQVWSEGNDSSINVLLEKEYKLIISNSDSLYLDCGFGSWVAEGLNWCAPYIGWQKIYDNKLDLIAGDYIDQILGAEAALWSEQIDEVPMESRVWPRLSALAERLWTDPETGWEEADSRMLMHRKRLTQMGLKADRLQPQWCLQNEGQCPI